MSKINTLRIINLNYNNNAIRIDDESFHLATESTLLSLRNGGGKSVLVQMMTAPFVQKRYRDTKDRPFKSYFTTSKPTHILVEWQLDGGAGYVLTGMMVRKKQDQGDEQGQEELEILTYIHEYTHRSPYDIHRMPLVEQQNEQKKLKGFLEVKKLLEELKKDKTYSFNYYDLNQPTQARRYFEHLKEYKIDHKEWESIIKKINFEESGLSKLFAEAKDEKGLVEKWFLPTIEDKLTKEEGKIKKFTELVVKYIHQYKANQSKIQRKGTIDAFKEEAQVLIEGGTQLQGELQQVRAIEKSIAQLIQYLIAAAKESDKEQKALELHMEEIEEMIRQIDYEALSYEIYNLEDEKTKEYEAVTAFEDEISHQEVTKASLTKRKNSQECAKLYKAYTEASKEVQEWENALEMMKQKDKDLTPERDQIGCSLRCHYEETLKHKNEALHHIEQQIQEGKKERTRLAQHITSLNEMKNKSSLKKGQLLEQIKQFGRLEETFNSTYQDNFSRNIMGEYEEGFLEDKLENRKRYEEKLEKTIAQLKNTREEQEEKLKAGSRDVQDLEKALWQEEESKKQVQKQIAIYDQELEERGAAIKYIDLAKDLVFEEEKIMEAFDHKLGQLSTERRELESELEKKEEDYQKLKTGKILEIPKALEDKLKSQDIHYVYGMDWLKHNYKSLEENEKLVASNPFIPYALIMPQKDLVKLQGEALDLYTSFPIPIIKKEDLEQQEKRKGNKVYTLEKVSFIIAFNQKLLDEKGLEELLEAKAAQLSQLKERLARKKEDLSFYEGKKNLILYQKVNKDNYQEAGKKLEAHTQEIERKKEQLNTLRKANALLEDAQKDLEEKLKDAENTLRAIQRQLHDLQQLLKAYLHYYKQKKELEKLEKELKEQADQICQAELNKAQLEEDYQKAEEERANYNRGIDELKDKLTKFEGYTQGERLLKDIEDLEARYNSITEKIQGDQLLLEKNLEKAQGRFKQAENELMDKQEEYQLIEEDYRTLFYDRFLEAEIKKELVAVEEKMKDLASKQSESKIQIAKLETKIENQMKALEEKVRETAPKPRSLIKAMDFGAARRQKGQELSRQKELFKEILNKQKEYKDNLGYLKEYEYLLAPQEESLPTLPDIKVEELSTLRGKLLRDYKVGKEEAHKKQRQVEQNLERIMRKECFKDDFFSIPLENLELLTETPDIFLEQLEMTLTSYNDLIAKLEVDIAMIGEEKEKVLEILLQYIQEVHQHMGKIDKNSTITIRNRTIKMLKLLLPKWEEQENLYKQRLRDFLDLLTDRGIQNLEKNEQIEELVGSQITTKNLYNDVVGIGNIEIKLYKIEEEREYPISWADVSKNSGGEGFLSAFVILSSLLSFMRRDDTDIFAEYEDGKVLVMDNPFAQTNAEHLLKPLMDIAKKSNTQLICLSGLGGESIYNRFDNIYVLNLISSRLKNGTQYLRSEHKKGEDREDLVATHMKIEDVEQIQLF